MRGANAVLLAVGAAGALVLAVGLTVWSEAFEKQTAADAELNGR